MAESFGHQILLYVLIDENENVIFQMKNLPREMRQSAAEPDRWKAGLDKPVRGAIINTYMEMR